MEVKPTIDMISHTPDPEKTVAAAARLCYSPRGVPALLERMTDEEIRRLIDMLVEMGHQSTVEHVSFSFAIEGVSRSMTHQLVRHRIASYSQKSQRYVREGGFDYIIPESIAASPKLKDLYIQNMEQQQLTYDTLVEELMETIVARLAEEGIPLSKSKGMAEKQAIEDARYVLPNACETKILVTMNARSLLHFFSVRCCNRAQWEIRHVATEMLKHAKHAAPNLFRLAGPGCVSGPCPEGKMTCGKSKEVAARFRNLYADEDQC